MNWLKFLVTISVIILCIGLANAQNNDEQYSNKGVKLIQELTLTSSKNADFPERYVFYFKPLTDVNSPYSYMASAGHKITELFVKTENGWLDIIHEILISTKNTDIYIGIMVDSRKDLTYFTINKYRETPLVAYTVQEPVSLLRKPPIQALQRINQEELNNTRLELCQNDNLILFQAEVPIRPGFSGAPIVSEDGDLLGILIGSCQLDSRIYYVTPISTVLKIFNKYTK